VAALTVRERVQKFKTVFSYRTGFQETTHAETEETIA
jgi:hypothetical protein